MRLRLTAFVLPLLLSEVARSAAARSPAVHQSIDLYSLLSGRTPVVSSRYGDIPIRFLGNGSVTGRSPSAAFFGETVAADRGRWWISQPRLYVQWQNWMEGRPHCFAVDILDASTLHWRADDGQEGIARFHESAGSVQ